MGKRSPELSAAYKAKIDVLTLDNKLNVLKPEPREDESPAEIRTGQGL